MATPALESFCCFFNETDESLRRGMHGRNNLHLDMKVYNILCIASSAVSICGAIYQLVPRRPSGSFPRGQRELESFCRQNMIICWLALADLLASVGILVRSSMWEAGYIPDNAVTNATDLKVQMSHWFCAISSGWIQYFYMCTYFWTFCYALDIYLVIKEMCCPVRMYHVLCWATPGGMSIVGLIALYYPSIFECQKAWSNVLPNYVLTYLPILGVMVTNPCLFAASLKSVRMMLRGGGQYTDQERRIVSSARDKFILVMLVFYLCWLPNIFNGVLLLFHQGVSHGVFVALWMFMAIVNPLQAFLNSLVYRGVGGCRFMWCLPPAGTDWLHRSDIQHHSTEDSSEASPLLSFRNKRNSRRGT